MELNPSLDRTALEKLAKHKYASGTKSLLEVAFDDSYVALSHWIPKVS